MADVIMADVRRGLGFWLVLAASMACNSEQDDLGGSIAGQTGDEGATPWTPGGANGDSECPLSTTAEALALDEQAVLGFSGAEILAFVGGSHEARVRWNAQPAVLDFLDHALRVTPGGLDEPLGVTLGHDGSPPRFRARLATGAFDAGPACRGQLELDVVVELRSESGALDERWRGTLTAWTTTEAKVLLQAPTWRGRLPRQPDRSEGNFLNAQQGSLDVIDANDPGSALAWVDVLLRFRTGAVDGSVNGCVQTADGGAFLLPQLSDERDPAGWAGVIGDGYFSHIGGDE